MNSSGRSCLWLEVGIAGLVVTAISMLAVGYDWFEAFGRFSRRHENLELDETAPIVMIVLLACAILLLRRERRLRLRLRDTEARRRIAHRHARRDPLTTLGNRLAFDEAHHRAMAEHRGASILLVDLDDFKALNDRHGHGVGDLALRAVGMRLRRIACDAGVIAAARLGGDEFGLIAGPGCDAAALAGRIVEALGRPLMLRDVRWRIGASVGVASGRGRDASAADLRDDADAAMYEAKRAGGAGWRLARGDDRRTIDIAPGDHAAACATAGGRPVALSGLGDESRRRSG